MSPAELTMRSKEIWFQNIITGITENCPIPDCAEIIALYRSEHEKRGCCRGRIKKAILPRIQQSLENLSKKVD